MNTGTIWSLVYRNKEYDIILSFQNESLEAHLGLKKVQ
jgi:hypothetical protein